MCEQFLERGLQKISKLRKKPGKILSSSDDIINNFKELLKENYDFAKSEETFTSDALPELVIHKFDLEQIWQQLELQNDSVLTNSLETVSKLVAAVDRLWFMNITDLYTESENESQDGSPTQDQDKSEDKNVGFNNNEISTDISLDNAETSRRSIAKRSVRTSVVDDEFFKLDEMEHFLKSEETNTHNLNDNDSDNEGSIDLFDTNSLDDHSEENDESAQNPRYGDFFTEDDFHIKEMHCEENSENDSEHSANIETYKSTLELKDDRLKKKIDDYEQVAIKEKPWQLKGEVTADKRPQNSLLEEVVEFDLSTRPAPVVTEETTYKLEDIIKLRIKDKAWDDVERKAKIVESPLEYKKKLLLDQEKSKQSLTKIYEDEYLKQKEALNPEAAEKPEETPKEHIEIKAMMKSLFAKLDALSNFHFTPKRAVPELRVVNNMPAISMEEVAPVAFSDTVLLAPEEIKRKVKGELIGKGERTDTDKKRERRQKKLKQKIHAQEKRKKEKTVTQTKLGLGNKYSKIRASKLMDQVTKDRNIDKMDESAGSRSVKSSTAFFTQLQEEVTSHIKAKSKIKTKKPQHNMNAKKLKL